MNPDKSLEERRGVTSELELPLPIEYRRTDGLTEQQPPVNSEHLKRIVETKDEYKVKTGTYAGECVEYCKYEYFITSAGIRTTKEAWNIRDDLPKLPALVSLRPIDSIDHANLMNVLRSADLRSGGSSYGRPDGRDQGGEWFEIIGDDLSLRISCEPGQTIDQYDEAIKAIREIRTNTIRHDREWPESPSRSLVT